MDNVMREIIVQKITLNVGVGEPGEKLERIANLISTISGAKAVRTTTKRRIPEWNVRPGLQIGTKVTVRGKQATDLLNRLFDAVERKLSASKFDEHGNMAFGISEYVHIPDVKYDYSVGIIGLSVAVTLERRGFRIARKRLSSSIGKNHLIKKEEAISFIKDKFKVQVQ